jgi:hypothetical protein
MEAPLIMAGAIGVEPAPPAGTGRCSNLPGFLAVFLMTPRISLSIRSILYRAEFALLFTEHGQKPCVTIACERFLAVLLTVHLKGMAQ